MNNFLTTLNLLKAKGLILATDVDSILNDVTNSDSDALNGVTEKAQSLGGATYKLVIIIAMIIFAVGGVVAFIKLFLSNSQQRTEIKGDIVWKALAIIGAAAVIGLITTLFSLGGNLF